MQLAFLGDSLTEYGDWETLFPRDRVTNLGRAGETVEGLLQRIRYGGLIDDPPNHLFLMSGINNIAAGDNDFLGAFRAVAELCRFRWPSSGLVIQSILPVRVDWVDLGVIVTANRGLRGIACDVQAAYLDLYSGFVDRHGSAIGRYYAEDGYHLTAAGYARWARAIEEYLAV